MVWRAAHSRLKAKDPAYRARCRRHIVKILVASVALLLIFQIAFWLREAGVIPPEFRTVERIIVVLGPDSSICGLSSDSDDPSHEVVERQSCRRNQETANWGLNAR